MNPQEDGSSPAKKVKNSDDDLPPLDQFALVSVLGNDIDRKSAFLHIERKINESDGDGTNGTARSDNAVVILDKKPFCDDDFKALLNSDKTKLRLLMRNDIYGGYEVELPPENNALKATIIYPATSKHIEKYRRLDSVMVAETSSDYQSITLPYISQNQFSTQWVTNVLNGTAEKERVFYTDDDFILAPDLKWDGTRLENLYVTAISRRTGIKSIRDLNASHLPLLKNIYKKGTESIRTKYNVAPSQLRIFAHYQPSYYHFHIHFVHVMFEAIGTSAGKAHLLADIIDNIEMVSDYYQKKTLYYNLKTDDALLMKFRDAKSSSDVSCHLSWTK